MYIPKAFKTFGMNNTKENIFVTLKQDNIHQDNEG
jgi:hypothetical protein